MTEAYAEQTKEAHDLISDAVFALLESDPETQGFNPEARMPFVDRIHRAMELVADAAVKAAIAKLREEIAQHGR